VLNLVKLTIPGPGITLDIQRSFPKIGDEPFPGQQNFNYPVTNVMLSSQSWRSFASGPWLTRDYEMNALNTAYLPQGQNPRDPLVSTLNTNVNGLPPAFVGNAQFDGYRDEGQAYAQKLQDADIPTIAKVYPGVIHDFLLMAGKLDASKTLIEDATAALRSAFGTTRVDVSS